MVHLQRNKNEVLCDFGTIPIGENSQQLLKEINLKTVPLDYCVKVEYYSQSSLDFSVEPRKFKNIKTNEQITISITYTPSVPNRTDFYYFEIERCDGFVLCVKVKGKSIGPKVTIPINVLKFHCKSLNEVEKKTFFIENTSAACARFMFDCNGCSCVKFVPEFGLLESFQTLRIIVSYTNKWKGQRFIRFMCLIENHIPLSIFITNIQTMKQFYSDDKNIVITPMLMCTMKTFIPQEEITSEKLTKIDDSVLSENCFSLSENFVDFGFCESSKTVHKSITLTNICGAEITFKWKSDHDENIFSIKQEQKIVPPFQLVTIDLTFSPKQHDRFYSSRFDATIFWGKAMALMPVNINLIGNSFQNNSWIAQYNLDLMDDKIYLISCNGFEDAISSSNIRTFTLRKFGHLPMMFKFSPPTLSSFTIEPLQGIIQGPYQIFTVKTKANALSENDQYLKETWPLTMNIGYQILITIIRISEEPNLMINDGKPVIFPVTHPLSCQMLCVRMKNPTKSCLRYSFEINDEVSVFKLPKYESFINSNECKKCFWFFIPKDVGQYESVATLLIHKTNSDDVIKRIPIFIKGECTVGHLKVDDDNLSLGKVILGNYKSKCFSILNDGKSSLHLSLGCKSFSGKDLSEIFFHPAKFTLEAGTVIQVELKAKPEYIDQHSLKIGCNLRSSSFSSQIIPDTWIDLAVFNIIGIYPRLKTTDVRMASIPFLTRCNIWNIMEINRLNEIISNLALGEQSKNFEINLPTLRACSPFNHKICIEMLLKNESDCTLQWSLKKNENPCTCKAEEKRIGFNTFVKEYNCEHSNQIEIEPTIGILESSKTMIWNITVQYFSPGVQKVDYELNVFPENKPQLATKLLLSFSRYVPYENQILFPCDYPKLIAEMKFCMQPIYINELKSQAQAFWVYNPTQYPVRYSVRKIRGTNNIKCLNPLQKVYPWSQHPIIFSYIPSKINAVKAKYAITFNRKKYYSLIVEGSSQLYPEYNPYSLCMKMPITKSQLPLSGLDLSVSHIALPVIASHCKVERIFFINNRTKNVFKYNWQRFILVGRLKLEVVPRSGSVQPMQHSLLTLKCTTLGRSCHLITGLVCRAVDETQASKHREKKLKFIEEEEKLAQEFTITEKGISFPEKRTLPEVEIDQEFLVLNVSVISTTANLEKRNAALGVEMEMIGRNSLLSFSTPEDAIENYISAIQFTDILSDCLWELVNSSSLKHTLRRRIPLHHYKDLFNGENRRLSPRSSEEKRDEKCPMNWNETVLSRMISNTLANIDLSTVLQRKPELLGPAKY